MREATWLASADPTWMLKYLRRRMSRRKLRLFIGEAFLPISQRGGCPLDDEKLSLLPNEIDEWANGKLDSRTVPYSSPLGLFSCNLLENDGFHYFDFARLVWDHDWLDAHRLAKAQRGVESARFAVLLRDIAGNPFRPVAFLPAWRTDTVVALARTMYDSREFGAMPILADALQDAGCENEHVLNHCRDLNQIHVRGCWVLDAVLQKS